MSVFLIGYRGSGKSTIGRNLARRLRQEFLDSDELIVKKAGKTIREIFRQEGEPAFRDLEAQIILELAGRKDHVIALGGGALERAENRRALGAGDHQIIYLRCEVTALLRRISGDAGTSDNRPHLSNLGGGIEEIQEVLAQREPIYRAAMTDELDVTHLTPDQAAEQIVRLL